MVDIHATEEEQLDQLKSWFKENGKYLAAGLLLGAGSIIGYRSWDAYQTDVARSASAAYETVRTTAESGNADQAQALGAALISDYPNSPYATHTALSLAVVALDAGKPEEAAKQLQWVLASGGQDSLKHVARLRLARVQLHSLDQPHEALDSLAGETGGEFAALYDEVRGDAHLALNEADKARIAYQSALDNWSADYGDSALLRMKLDDLAVGQ